MGVGERRAVLAESAAGGSGGCLYIRDELVRPGNGLVDSGKNREVSTLLIVTVPYLSSLGKMA